MLRGSVPYGGAAAHTFSRAPQATIPRSKFNRSHGVKNTFDEGYLVPILVDEMLPGDTSGYMAILSAKITGNALSNVRTICDATCGAMLSWESVFF